MKLSERFDRRYQQTPAVTTAPPAAPAAEPEAAPDGNSSIAPVERRAVAREAPTAPQPVVETALHSLDSIQWIHRQGYP